ncbi:MAG: sodium:solute symporter family protein [Desulfotomaculales bacterium]
MTGQVAWVIGVLIVYLAAILFIGLWSMRYARFTLEDYAMGSRSFGFWILFSTVFAANISAVTLIGIPGAAYHVGWIMWPYFVTSWGWFTPWLFWLLSNRAWILGQRYGYMTQAEIIKNRWDSPALGVLFSICLLFYSVPYLMTGIQGGGNALAGLTGNAIPYWAGCLIVAVIVCAYLVAGGMRGAAWVNTLQAAIFMIGVVIIFFSVANVFGGMTQATQQVAEKYPWLLDRSKFSWKTFYSYGFIVALSVPVFPQVFMRMITGRSPRALKGTTMVYPLAGLIVFFTMAYSGMWGHLAFPDLKGAESDKILPMLLATYLHPALMAVLGSAIFAALMSTLDSQLWAVSVIFIKDFFLGKKTTAVTVNEAQAVKWSRIITILLTALAFILAQFKIIGIINIVNFAFAGFAVLIWPMLAALWWRRCTKQAAAASIISSQFVLLGLQYGILPKAWAFGFLPGLPAIIVGLVVLVAVTYLTPAPVNKGTQEFFETFAVIAPKESTSPLSAGRPAV